MKMMKTPTAETADHKKSDGNTTSDVLRDLDNLFTRLHKPQEPEPKNDWILFKHQQNFSLEPPQGPMECSQGLPKLLNDPEELLKDSWNFIPSEKFYKNTRTDSETLQ